MCAQQLISNLQNKNKQFAVFVLKLIQRIPDKGRR